MLEKLAAVFVGFGAYKTYERYQEVSQSKLEQEQQKRLAELRADPTYRKEKIKQILDSYTARERRIDRLYYDGELSLFSSLIDSDKNALDAVGELKVALKSGEITARDFIEPIENTTPYEILASEACIAYIADFFLTTLHPAMKQENINIDDILESIKLTDDVLKQKITAAEKYRQELRPRHVPRYY